MQMSETRCCAMWVESTLGTRLAGRRPSLAEAGASECELNPMSAAGGSGGWGSGVPSQQQLPAVVGRRPRTPHSAAAWLPPASCPALALVFSLRGLQAPRCWPRAPPAARPGQQELLTLPPVGEWPTEGAAGAETQELHIHSALNAQSVPVYIKHRMLVAKNQRSNSGLPRCSPFTSLMAPRKLPWKPRARQHPIVPQTKPLGPDTRTPEWSCPSNALI